LDGIHYIVMGSTGYRKHGFPLTVTTITIITAAPGCPIGGAIFSLRVSVIQAVEISVTVSHHSGEQGDAEVRSDHGRHAKVTLMGPNHGGRQDKEDNPSNGHQEHLDHGHAMDRGLDGCPDIWRDFGHQIGHNPHAQQDGPDEYLQQNVPSGHAVEALLDNTDPAAGDDQVDDVHEENHQGCGKGPPNPGILGVLFDGGKKCLTGKDQERDI